MTDRLRDVTLCFLIQKSNEKIERICLAMKKKGFGKGKWNGVGGKVEQGETIEEAVVREAMEEISVNPIEIEKVAVITFLFPHNKDWNQLVHVYFASSWDGEPKESDEMRPQWFSVRDIPYESMWVDDKIWLSKVLNGEKVIAMFAFDENEMVIDQEISLVRADEL
jgi:mutator protein MutT